MVEVDRSLGPNVSLEPLQRHAVGMAEPFEKPGDPLADWYRAAKRRMGLSRNCAQFN